MGVGFQVPLATGFASERTGGLAPCAMVKPWREGGLGVYFSSLGGQPGENSLRDICGEVGIASAAQSHPLHQPQVFFHEGPEGVLGMPGTPCAEQVGISPSVRGGVE